MDNSNPRQPLVVTPGCMVKLDLVFEDEKETLIVAIVPDELADLYAGFLGEGTPLAQAILGKQPGDKVDYQFGQAIIRELRIDERVLPMAKENAQKRKEQADQTQKEIAKANATIFSLTVESKWGDYDPDGIEW